MFRKSKICFLNFNLFCKIGKSYFIYKFLYKLGTKFEIIFVIFHQIYNLIKSISLTTVINIVDIIFNKVGIIIK